MAGMSPLRGPNIVNITDNVVGGNDRILILEF